MTPTGTESDRALAPVPRFWLPPDGILDLADAGFLPDPEETFGAAHNPELVEFSQLRDVGCLFLLGEPGFGKSTALRAAITDLREGAGGIDESVLAVDLGATGQESLLSARIFEADAYREWQDGTGVLHLLLDSLDEARIRVETVADLLLDGLEGCDFQRLRLRIACRSADRHHRLEATLREWFGDERFGVFELVPLRRRDVGAIAEAAGAERDQFLREVVQRNLQPLASRPLTLDLLLRAAVSSEGMPDSATEAYQQGCRLLVREPDEDRRSGVAAGALDPGQRIAVASRMAAAVFLSGRSAVLVDDEQPPSPDDVLIDALAGGRELRGSAVEDSFTVDERAVREVLGTGLFTSRGEGRLGITHQTFGEFLAARYLAERMRSEQVLDLLTLSEDSGRRIVPQLREVATWLATLSPPLFEALLLTDPDVVLRGDLALVDDGQREALVDALLEGVKTGSVSRWDSRIRANMTNLMYPGLEEQVRVVLLDPSAPPQARELAADLAGATQLVGLADTLADLALDSDAPLHLRVSSASALRGWAPVGVVERLNTLALEPIEVDDEDELRGAALRAVWPRAVNAEDLFPSLTPPRRRNLLGFYKAFLIRELMEALPAAALPTALDWAATQPLEHFPTDAMSDLREQVLVRAWQARDDPAVFTRLVPVVLSFLKGGFNLLSHDEVQRGEAFVDRGGRRRLVEGLLPAVADESLSIAHLLFSTPQLLDADDVPWLIECLREAVGDPLERSWAILIEGMLARSIASADVVMEAREQSNVLHEVTSSWFDPVELGSAAANSQQETWARWQRLSRDAEDETAEPLDIDSLVKQDLERLDSGALDAFWHLVEHLAIDPESRGHNRHFQSDLTEFPGWNSADPGTRERIIDGAETYLVEQDPETDRWFAERTIWKPAWAAYRALRLLLGVAPDRLERLGSEPWARWSPIIMSWPRDGTDEAEFNDDLVRICFDKAKVEASSWFLHELDRSTEREGSAWAVRRARCVELGELEAPLLERVCGDDWPAPARAEVLQLLLQRESAAARDCARSSLTAERLDDLEQREVALEIAQVVVEEAPDAGWPEVWPLVTSDKEFGRALFERVASTRERLVADRLNEPQLAALFEWLEENYPHSDDPPIQDGVHHVGPREQIAWWRDAVVRGLASKGTDEAVRQLDVLKSRFPNLLWLRGLRSEAQELLRRERWNPPDPADVVGMGSDVVRRWVTSDDELREVVIESLARAQEELQASTPAAVDLWDETARRPKHENQISDWLKRWLERDLGGRGIVVGREVQIRPGPGGKMGEAGDLVLEAIAGERVEGADTVSITIEVKGCWHAEVDEAMRTQLAERYLMAEGQKQGIYVVAWFAADDWDESDWRCSRCGRRTLQETKDFFETQAGETSSEFDVVIGAVVLDCSLPPKDGPARRE